MEKVTILDVIFPVQASTERFGGMQGQMMLRGLAALAQEAKIIFEVITNTATAPLSDTLSSMQTALTDNLVNELKAIPDNPMLAAVTGTEIISILTPTAQPTLAPTRANIIVADPTVGAVASGVIALIALAYILYKTNWDSFFAGKPRLAKVAKLLGLRKQQFTDVGKVVPISDGYGTDDDMSMSMDRVDSLASIFSAIRKKKADEGQWNNDYEDETIGGGNGGWDSGGESVAGESVSGLRSVISRVSSIFSGRARSTTSKSRYHSRGGSGSPRKQKMSKVSPGYLMEGSDELSIDMESFAEGDSVSTLTTMIKNNKEKKKKEKNKSKNKNKKKDKGESSIASYKKVKRSKETKDNVLDEGKDGDDLFSLADRVSWLGEESLSDDDSFSLSTVSLATAGRSLASKKKAAGQSNFNMGAVVPQEFNEDEIDDDDSLSSTETLRRRQKLSPLRFSRSIDMVEGESKLEADDDSTDEERKRRAQLLSRASSPGEDSVASLGEATLGGVSMVGGESVGSLGGASFDGGSLGWTIAGESNVDIASVVEPSPDSPFSISSPDRESTAFPLAQSPKFSVSLGSPLRPLKGSVEEGIFEKKAGAKHLSGKRHFPLSSSLDGDALSDAMMSPGLPRTINVISKYKPELISTTKVSAQSSPLQRAGNSIIAASSSGAFSPPTPIKPRGGTDSRDRAWPT